MEQSHVALSGPSPLTFREGAPEDRSQSWDERGRCWILVSSWVRVSKLRNPLPQNAQPLGKQGAAGSQRGTERLKRGKGPGFQLRRFVSSQVLLLSCYSGLSAFRGETASSSNSQTTEGLVTSTQSGHSYV